MWSCFDSDSNHYVNLEQTSNQYLEEATYFFNQIKQKVTETSYNLYALCSPAEKTYLGRLSQVIRASRRPTGSSTADESNSCHHLLVFEDGANFLLSFDDIYFDQLEPHLQPGYLLKVLYRTYDNKVINIFPQPYFRKTTLGEAIESNSVNLTDDLQIKIHFLEGRQTKVEIYLDQQLINSADDHQLINPANNRQEVDQGDLDLDCMLQEY